MPINQLHAKHSSVRERAPASTRFKMYTKSACIIRCAIHTDVTLCDIVRSRTKTWLSGKQSANFWYWISYQPTCMYIELRLGSTRQTKPLAILVGLSAEPWNSIVLNRNKQTAQAHDHAARVKYSGRVSLKQLDRILSSCALWATQLQLSSLKEKNGERSERGKKNMRINFH